MWAVCNDLSRRDFIPHLHHGGVLETLHVVLPHTPHEQHKPILVHVDTQGEEKLVLVVPTATKRRIGLLYGKFLENHAPSTRMCRRQRRSKMWYRNTAPLRTGRRHAKDADLGNTPPVEEGIVGVRAELGAVVGQTVVQAIVGRTYGQLPHFFLPALALRDHGNCNPLSCPPSRVSGASCPHASFPPSRGRVVQRASNLASWWTPTTVTFVMPLPTTRRRAGPKQTRLHHSLFRVFCPVALCCQKIICIYFWDM